MANIKKVFEGLVNEYMEVAAAADTPEGDSTKALVLGDAVKALAAYLTSEGKLTPAEAFRVYGIEVGTIGEYIRDRTEV